MLPDSQSIALLLGKLSEGKISRPELDQLYDLIRKDTNAELLSDTMMDQLNHYQFVSEDIQFWQAQMAHIPQSIVSEKTIDENAVGRTPLIRNIWFRLAAAVVSGLLLLGAYYFVQQPFAKTVAAKMQIPSQPADIDPGYSRAILTLSSGEQVVLDNAGPVISDGKLSIQNNNGQLSYSKSGTAAFNTMTTPKGGQYQLTLSDGTKIWLNAESSITFPTAFTGTTRDVKVSGEIYFEVSRDAKKPFRVMYNGQMLEVLGTSFNINNYANEKGTVTTLIDGAVRVSAMNERPVVLKQHEQVILTNELKVRRNVNTEQVLAWKNGSFNFDGQDFGASMRQLERWYNIRIVYDNGIPDQAFGGEIDRSMTLSKALKVLDGIVARFRLEGNVLHVMKL